MESKLSHIADRVNMNQKTSFQPAVRQRSRARDKKPSPCFLKHKTYRKAQSLVPWRLMRATDENYRQAVEVLSNLQKKAKAFDTHIDKRRSVITTFPICKEKRENLKYEKSAKKVNPYGLDFPDNFMAIMGWRRVKV